MTAVSEPAYPYAGMVLSGSTLYGTTEGGGGAGASGTVFQINTDGTGFAVAHTFPPTVSGTNSDGAHPEAGLTLSGDTLYGTASGGGKGHGTVFSLNISNSGFTNLYNFTNGVDGSAPVAGLLLSGGTLYGTASSGGISPGWGTVFKLGIDGTEFLRTLYESSNPGPQNKGSTLPEAGLVISGQFVVWGPRRPPRVLSAESCFGSTRMARASLTLANGNDGNEPQGGLALSGDTFYGTTSGGGIGGAGVVFKVATNGTGFAVLHMFPAANYDSASGGNFNTNSDGAIPVR